MRRLLTFLLCLAATITPHAAEKWTYARSDHFEVYATGGDRQAKDALAFFEQVHTFFADFLKLAPHKPKPTRLIVFSGRSQFAAYKPNDIAGAYYVAAPDTDLIVLADLDPDWYSVVVHEYAHLVMRHSGAAYPLWLNEGLAEFFSTMTPQGGAMAIGKVPPGAIDELRTGGLMPIGQLLSVNHDSPEYNKFSHAGTFYAQSWALTHMLLTNEKYRTKADEFLARMAAGGVSAAQVMQSLFGKTAETVGEELGVYVRRNQFLVYIPKYKSPADLFKAVPRPVDEFEAGLMTAGLLANLPKREPDARAAFEKLATGHADDVRLLEARGLFEWQEGHRDAAAPLLSRAATLGSTNSTVYRLAGQLESDPARQSEILSKALSIAPDDLEVRMNYAISLLNRQQYGAAVATLGGAPRVTPDEAFDLFILLGEAYGAMNQRDAAKQAVAKAASYATTQAQRDRAARLGARLEPGTAAPQPSGRLDWTDTAASSASALETATYRSITAGLMMVKGRIVNLICGQDPPDVMEIKTDVDTIRLLIDVGRVFGTGPNGSIEFRLTCAPMDVPIEAGYAPGADEKTNTVGTVRSLHFPEWK